MAASDWDAGWRRSPASPPSCSRWESGRSASPSSLLPGYQQRVVERVHEATGLRLQFDSVYARIGRYGPEIVFRGARVLPETGDEPLVTAAAGRVSLSIPRSIWYRRARGRRACRSCGRKLGFVITPDGPIRFVGQSALQRRDAKHAPMTLDRLPRGRYGVDDAILDVLDLRARQGRFQLTGVDIEVVREGDEITLSGRVELPEHLGSFIDFDGQANGDLADNCVSLACARSMRATWILSNGPRRCRTASACRRRARLDPCLGARGRPIVSSLRVEPALTDLRLAGSSENSRAWPATSASSATRTTFRSRPRVSSFARPARPWRPTSLAARLTRKDGRIAAVAARADYLRIENLAAFAAALPQGRCGNASRRSRPAAN